jgi:hypothetical protein
MSRDAHTEPPTLEQLRQASCWWWVHCLNVRCLHKTPTAIMPYIIRWGAEASSDRLRASARCSRCGARGATLQHPSWGGREIGWTPFPVSEWTDQSTPSAPSRASVLPTAERARQAFPDQDEAHVIAAGCERAARPPVVAEPRAMGARQAGAGHFLQIEGAEIGDLLETLCGPFPELSLSIAFCVDGLWRIEADQAIGLAAGPDGVAIDDGHVAAAQRLRQSGRGE